MTTIEAIKIGPTWQVDETGAWVLPERTLGWQVIDWVETWCRAEDGSPFQLTPEQRRFLLWWYAVDHRGRFVYRRGILQRLKGWGKDPLAAVISLIEFVGPCRFSHWATAHDVEDLDMLEIGDPVAMTNPSAWIQIAAVSKDQTRNTMTIFPSMISPALKAAHAIDIGKEVIYAYHGARRIEAVTSSPRALEGGRPTLVIQNETHHWLENNEGHAMAAVSDRNLTKSKGGGARTLSITNAYEPSENSVAQLEREAYEAEATGQAIKTGILYDSLEAPPSAMLSPKFPDREPTEDEIKAYIGAVIEAVRGDATWLDVEGITASILDRRNPPSQSRRFWYNQIVAAEDAWVDPQAVDAAVDPLIPDMRRGSEDQLRAGWLVMPDEPIVMFLDCSKSDDATGLVGCRISDGYVFTLGVWAKPPGDAGKGWVVSRESVDSRVHEAMDRFNVVAFWGDPSHAKNEDATRFWDAYFDRWHLAYGEQLQVWSVKTGVTQSSIMWDMTSPERTRQFVAAAETFVDELQEMGLDGYAPSFRHDGHPALIEHLKNARRYPMREGVSLWKGHRESARKVDLAVCAVGARMLRRIVNNIGVQEEVEAGTLWGAWR